ncbi:amino acid ABC transporter permease [Vibrio algivorus]|uniref:Amino acid ABC transporter permease n=1 Tax=Vibrio algivorus TaxID=1667024 RepID=A0A557NYS5_9VIBR|nr:amino acid ABC transporter permease [Vibrio algivorus]TVO33577.1 amino acid ABC transporter permease [Vibrio algivorus]GLT13958.1 amino acid ABC transporter permease [Vibrio algivorus]
MKPNESEKAVNQSASGSSLSHLIYNPRFRSIAFQLITVAVLGYFFYIIINNTIDNLNNRGISTGFGFLDRQAGFGISLALIEYDETYTFGRTFIVGLLNTVLVSFLGIILATILGFTVGIARLSSNWMVNRLAAVYIEIVRNVPPLLQILFWYFAVLQALPSARQSLSLGEVLFLNIRGLYVPKPVFESGSWLIGAAAILAVVLSIGVYIWAKNRQKVTGLQTPVTRIVLGLCIGLPIVAYFIMGMPISADYPELKGFNFKGGITVLPELFALWLALGIFTSAFIAEIVRSGIEAVSHGQTEAATALGLSQSKTLKLVVIPQAMRIIVPPLTSEYLNLTKNSSLAMAIGYPDLVSVFAGTTLNQTGQAIEIIFMTMGVYLGLSLLTSWLMNIYNRKVALVER